MKRPNAFTFVIGNPISVALIASVTCYLGYEALNGAVSWFFVIFVGLITLSAMNANGRLTRYNDWKREWDAMDGKRPFGFSFSISKNWSRWIFGIPTWLLFAYLVSNAGNDPTMKLAAGLFWLATLIGIVSAIIQWLRTRRRSVVETATSKDVPVTLCVGLPATSPDLRHAYGALPSYCLPVLQKSQDDGR